MKIKRRINGLLRIYIILSCILLIFATISYAATTLMTYKGEMIRDKMSISSFSLTSKSEFTVKHTTTSEAPAKLHIQLYKKGTDGKYDYTGNEITKTGKGNATVTWSKGKGTYKLRFYVPKPSFGSWLAADINGKVVK